MPATTTPNLQQARRYLRRIKSELGSTSPRYRAFLNILRDYDASTTSPEYIHRLRHLLDGHENLLNGLNAYLPDYHGDESEDEGPSSPTARGRYAPIPLLAWIETQNPNLEDTTEAVHIQCTKCKFCEGSRNAYAIRTNEPILLCELKGCNREYHLNCLPEGVLTRRGRINNGATESDEGRMNEHEHIVYIDKDLGDDEAVSDEGIPPGEIYCKECMTDGSTTVLRQYFRRCEEIRRNYSCSRDYVLALLERHMIDNPLGNIVDSEGVDISTEDEHEEVHLKLPPRSELWYVEKMNKMARLNPFEKDGGAGTFVPESDGEEKDAWSVADFMIGKPVRLYCNLDNEYHNGRIIDWRTSSVYENSKIQKPCKNREKTVHLTELDFYGSGPLSSCEFLVRFPANEGRRKKEMEQWIILEEHSLAVGITLVRGQHDIKSSSVDKWRPAMVLARSALELVPVREFLQEGKEGELFGQKILEEAERGVSEADDMFALTSFFGGKDHEVLNVRNEVKGLITWELLEKYHIDEELKGREVSKDEAASPGAGEANEDNKGTLSKKARRLSIPIPQKMGLALSEYKDQYYAKELYKTLSSTFSGGTQSAKAVSDDRAPESEVDDQTNIMQIDDALKNTESLSVEQKNDQSANFESEPDVATSQDQPAADAPPKQPEIEPFSQSSDSDEVMTEVGLDRAVKEFTDSKKKEPDSDRPADELRAEAGDEIGAVTQAAVESAEVDIIPPNEVDDGMENHADTTSLNFEIEEECDEDIYADYDIVEVDDDADDDSSSSDDAVSVDSGIDSVESFSYSGKGSKGSQPGRLTRRNSHTRRNETGNLIEKGQTVIGGKRVSVDVVRTGSRGRPRHVNVSPESKGAPVQEESRKRPSPQARAEPAPKKPAPAPRPKPASRPSSPEGSSDDDDMPVPAASNLPKGITQRPSGKWQAQLYYAGKSRYLGVFNSRKHAFKAYEVARKYLMTDEATKGASSSSDINLYISKARQQAKHALLKKK